MSAGSRETDRPTPLLGVPMFNGLSANSLALITAIASEETIRRGTVLFRGGDPGDRMYVILQGAVRISREMPGMGEEALAILGAGDYFGEMALLDDFPRSADARAHEDSHLLVITKADMEHLLFTHRDLANEVLWNVVRTLCSRLRATDDKVTFLAMAGKFS